MINNLSEEGRSNSYYYDYYKIIKGKKQNNGKETRKTSERFCLDADEREGCSVVVENVTRGGYLAEDRGKRVTVNS